MKTVFRKILVVNSVILFLLAIIIFFFFSRIINQHYTSTLEHNLEIVALSLMPEGKILFLNNKDEASIRFFTQLAKDKSLRITLIQPNGKVIFDTDYDYATMEDHKFRPEIQQALLGSPGHAIRYSQTLKKNMLYTALPLGDKQRSGVVRVSMSMDRLQALLGGLWIGLAEALFIVLLIVFFIMMVLSRMLVNPIPAINSALTKVSEGDFETKLTINTNDEFNTIAKHFNQMTQKIKALFAEIQQQKEDVQALIAALQEGILVINVVTGKIQMMNKACHNLCSLTNIQDDYYWNVLRSTHFDAMIKQAIEKKEDSQQELTIEHKTYLAIISFYHGFENLICVFQDITSIKYMNEMKKQFVDNVSHELRTPLTAINGYLETIEEESDAAKKKQYMQIVKKHTQRLINIVNDLLLLSKTEQSQNNLVLQILNLADVIHEVTLLFANRIQQKNLVLKLDVPKIPAKIKGDKFQLEQLLINLIDNAVKYTDQGGITISIKQIEKQVILVITDTGHGIPPEAQPHVFERFYVADKSRSRETGGTGLGLAIVKHIVAQHSGTIDLESKVEEGTSFRIAFPHASAIN